MKKWWMKGLAVALCAGMLAPAAAVSVPGMGMTVYATNNGAGASGADDPKKNENPTTPTEDPAVELQKAKEGAMGKLQDYQRLVDPDGKKATKLNDIVTKALNQISAMTTADGVNDYITKAKGDMDKVVNPPKDDSNDDDDNDEDTVPVNADHFLMVGGTWVTPVANAGQEVSIVLPVVNMGKTNVTNAVVTPVLSTDTATWPFEITQSSYSQNIADLPDQWYSRCQRGWKIIFAAGDCNRI